MRAAIVQQPGAEPHVGTVDSPVRSSNSTLIQVSAAPLNPLDLLIASGTFHSARHELPYVPGSECVGQVVESERFAPGTLVYAECHATPGTPGSFASHVLVDDDDVLELPAGLDPVRGAAIGNSGTAAFLPLVSTAGLKVGETVLVLGATGAVGQLAVQIAHLRGAGRVVGVGRDRNALAGLLHVGADATVELRSAESVDDLAARLIEATGGVSAGADVVLDGLYGRPIEAALRACAPRARVVNVGHSAGADAVIPAGLLRGRQLTLTGFAGLHTPLHEKRPALEWLWNALAKGDLRMPVQAVSLEDLPTVWRAQAASPHAKYVVLPSQPFESER